MRSTKSRSDRLDQRWSAQPSHPSFLAPRAWLASSLALVLAACSPSSNNQQNGSGGNGSGGSSGSGSGGSAKGGSSGSGSGGSAKGGSSGSGSGGSAKGGSSGSGSGGSAKGGSSGSGGSSDGGSSGSGSGGASGGGSSGSGSGGSSSGGGSGSGSGGAAGGSGGAGGGDGGSSGSRPPGYFYTKDWNVTKVDWHGCVWASKDNDVAGSTTTISPEDFMSTKDGGPYKLTGTIHNAYEAVALMGFNINEDINGKSDQCKADPTIKDGPPSVTMPPSGATGIAVNWSAAKLPADFRIQIQGVKGAADADQRWCAGIKDASGPSFIPFTDFNTQCWSPADGKKYNNEPIDAVAFLVPGTTSEKKDFDITIGGFAPGTSKADAPGPAGECGTKSGTVGATSVNSDSTKAEDASMERVATQGKDCKKYILNNNNWGSPTSSFQQLSYTGNTFKVTAMNGTGSSAPASFPSLFIGGNGQIGTGGVYSTWEDSGLPKQIKSIGTAKTTFKWSGKSSGDFNATYDVWFSKNSPTAGSYNDAISGFIMVWFYKPSSRQPIGSVVRQATIAGQQWDVWAGPRGNTSTGTDPAGRPVISYVAKSQLGSLTFDLKDFMNDAVSKADSANGITQTFSDSWYLTDVFAGFEIWSGGQGLSCDEFSAEIK
jgi:hypothetical protein